MNTKEKSSSDPALARLPGLLPELEALYTDVHAHPELSMQETRTAGLAAERLRAAGYDVTTAIGKTGVVGLLRNGAGPTVMLRADMDALPVEEATGLPYASKVRATDRDGKTVPVMHACGHDMHVAWLVGATTLAQARDTWHGTLMAVFHPAEETAEGAQAMIDDGLFDRFPKPDVVLGQHVMVGPAGTIGGRAGAITSAADSLQIRLFGRGAHGSMPQASIDPVVMAAATVMRLQTIVSANSPPPRPPWSLSADCRPARRRTLFPRKPSSSSTCAALTRGCASACSPRSNGSSTPRPRPRRPRPPEITSLDRYPLVVNDPAGSKHVADAFRRHFSADRVRETGPAPASEDFGSFGAEWHAPSVFWFVGGTDPDRYANAKQAGRLNENPTNHNPRFAPVIHPTLQTGVEALIVAARAWLAP